MTSDTTIPADHANRVLRLADEMADRLDRVSGAVTHVHPFIDRFERIDRFLYPGRVVGAIALVAGFVVHVRDDSLGNPVVDVILLGLAVGAITCGFSLLLLVTYALFLGVDLVFDIVDIQDRSLQARAARSSARLLPAGVAARYAEEWAGELYDLRAEGASWWRRARHVTGILLCAVPLLAVQLRPRPRRVVD